MSARDEAVEMIRRICPPHLDADEYGRILAEKFDTHLSEGLRAAAADIGDRVRAGGPRARGLAHARNLLNDRADGIIPTPPRRNVVHRDVAARLRRQPGEEMEVGCYASRESANGIAALVRGRAGTVRAYLPAGSFDARVVPGEDGVRVLARFVGGAAV